MRHALEDHGRKLLPGREVAFGSHHVLVFSADEDLLRSLPEKPTAEQLADAALACLWAHPAFPGGAGVYPPMVPDSGRMKEFLSAVELLNGRRMHVADGISQAADAARQLGLPLTAGSDAHRPDEVGKCFTEVDVDDAADATTVVAAIRAGRVAPHLSAPWAALHGYDYRQELAGFVK